MHLQTCRAHIKVSVVAGVPCSNTTCVHVRLDPQHPLCVTNMFKAAHLLSHKFVWVWCSGNRTRATVCISRHFEVCSLLSSSNNIAMRLGVAVPEARNSSGGAGSACPTSNRNESDALREAVILPRRHCWRMYYRAMYPWRFSLSQSSSSSPLYKRRLGPLHVESVEMRSAWEFFATVRSCRELSKERQLYGAHFSHAFRSGSARIALDV